MLADRLEQCLKGYADAEAIVNGFRNGFSIGIMENPQIKLVPKFFPAKKKLLHKILDEVDKGRIIGPFEVDENIRMVSPVQVIPKPNSDKVRMIFNLSHPKGFSINDNIKQEAISVRYCSVSDVVQWLMDMDRSGKWFLAKIDLTDAYRMVPIKKDEWTYLGMKVGSEVFVDRCLPMGASSSCCTFQRISDALAWGAKSKSPVYCQIFNYLDDFLIIANSEGECEQALNHFERLCGWLGIPISTHKTVRPTRSIVFLGIGIDSEHKVLFIPPEKAKKTLEDLKKFLKLKKPMVKEWQSTLGKLSHLTHVISAGRIHLSSVYGSLKGILSQENHVRRFMTKEVKDDLGVWNKFLSGLPPMKAFRMLQLGSSNFSIYTDSSKTVGYGAIMGRSWLVGVWPNDNWRSQNIALLELYPIYAAVMTWIDQLKDSVVTCVSDNEALVEMLKKLYTKDRKIRQLMKPLVLQCLKNNIFIKPVHIAGVDNVGPDLLSRGKLIEFRHRFSDMKLRPDVVPELYRPKNVALV